MTQYILGKNPFEILFKDFFETKTYFNQLEQVRVKYPVDIYESKQGLTFELAVSGISQEDIEINVESDVLRIQYNNDKEGTKDDRQYILRHISNRSFNLGWRIGSQFDLRKVNAVMDKGLLIINVPYSEQAAPVKVNITNS